MVFTIFDEFGKVRIFHQVRILYVCIHTYRLGDISPNLGKYRGVMLRCCKVVSHAFGCFRRVMVWFVVFVSIRQIKAEFNHFRAFYGYQWGSVCICGWIWGRKEGRGQGRKKKHPLRVLLSDIGF